MQRTTVAALAILLAVGGAILVLRPFSGGGEPVSVLFVGNSYTASNDLAGMYTAMAAAGGYSAEVAVVAPGGVWLRDHVASGEPRAALSGGNWDFVVLQEQSVVPASPTERMTAMYPAVRELAAIAEASDTESVLFLTWARRDGFPDVGYGSYQPMQRAITAAYEEIGGEVGARVAPVGEAWALANLPSFDLYQSDGSHPSEAGTYLAAAVLYATITGEDPVEVNYAGPLDAATAESLRWIAGRTVLDDHERWRVPTTPLDGH